MSSILRLGVLLPGKFKKFAIFPGAPSLISLYRYYGSHGLDDTLLLVLRGYETVLTFFLGWLKPTIEWVGQFIGWKVVLHPHWRHVLVLLGLYFMAGASVEREEHKQGRTSSWKFRLALGVSIAFVTSILVGAIPVSNTAFLPNFIIALIAFVMVACNDMLLRAYRGWRTLKYETQERIKGNAVGRWEYFWQAGRPITQRTIISLAVAAPLILAAGQVLAPGVAVLMLFVLYLGAIQIYLGAKELRHLRKPGEPWTQAAARSRGMLIGINMVVTFVVALVLVAVSVAKDLVTQ